ncbi:ABC transporter substrate-binding protein [Arthrobacter zhangbolii]|uniref:ABC transporter substrate-binding protein n=1 Tax=Arthrobacter zhangbolii TaxID=2886936 RepID=A0A9X1S8P9_9MICC|nr:MULTISPECIES: ABC transporter substrate-binding protein [Arthrobacter]MCC3272800.1 ABC transporter substrate-binding protein [Arthrobacter zhangbolii]MCC3294941.1 ABC transporter substrate-binding protein [Arthrobacter zhangbolii]MDN3903862.1 ABC transporter substrate-binding protein [Arthrobacter sp. YD2]UON91367.1 ABC transporter substrate-binding protein [Arthrobacter zhangbolii]
MMQHASRNPRRKALAVLAGGMALALAGCSGGGDPLENESAPAASGSSSEQTLVVGSADFPESSTIAEIYAGALNAAGVPAETRLGIGSREVYIPALEDGSIDLIPEYTGALLVEVDPETALVDPGEIVDALGEKLPENLVVLEPSDAQDKDAMVVTAATAEKYQLETVEDLAEVCGELTLGAPAEFAERTQGLAGLKEKYGCEFKEFTAIGDSGGPLTVDALINDDVQVADIYTTSPAIEENGLVVLEDPKQNWPAQQVIPLIADDRVSEEAREVLNSVSAQLTTEDLIALNQAVSGDQKLDPSEAAQDWLEEKGLA